MRCRCGQDKETHNKDRCKNDEGTRIIDVTFTTFIYSNNSYKVIVKEVKNEKL